MLVMPVRSWSCCCLLISLKRLRVPSDCTAGERAPLSDKSRRVKLDGLDLNELVNTRLLCAALREAASARDEMHSPPPPPATAPRPRPPRPPLPPPATAPRPPRPRPEWNNNRAERAG